MTNWRTFIIALLFLLVGIAHIYAFQEKNNGTTQQHLEQRLKEKFSPRTLSDINGGNTASIVAAIRNIIGRMQNSFSGDFEENKGTEAKSVEEMLQNDEPTASNEPQRDIEEEIAKSMYRDKRVEVSSMSSITSIPDPDVRKILIDEVLQFEYPKYPRPRELLTENEESLATITTTITPDTEAVNDTTTKEVVTPETTEGLHEHKIVKKVQISDERRKRLVENSSESPHLTTTESIATVSDAEIDFTSTTPVPRPTSTLASTFESPELEEMIIRTSSNYSTESLTRKKLPEQYYLSEEDAKFVNVSVRKSQQDPSQYNSAKALRLLKLATKTMNQGENVLSEETRTERRTDTTEGGLIESTTKSTINTPLHVNDLPEEFPLEEEVVVKYMYAHNHPEVYEKFRTHFDSTKASSGLKGLNADTTEEILIESTSTKTLTSTNENKTGKTLHANDLPVQFPEEEEVFIEFIHAHHRPELLEKFSKHITTEETISEKIDVESSNSEIVTSKTRKMLHVDNLPVEFPQEEEVFIEYIHAQHRPELLNKISKESSIDGAKSNTEIRTMKMLHTDNLPFEFPPKEDVFIEYIHADRRPELLEKFRKHMNLDESSNSESTLIRTKKMLHADNLPFEFPSEEKASIEYIHGRHRPELLNKFMKHIDSIGSSTEGLDKTNSELGLKRMKKMLHADNLPIEFPPEEEVFIEFIHAHNRPELLSKFTKHTVSEKVSSNLSPDTTEEIIIGYTSPSTPASTTERKKKSHEPLDVEDVPFEFPEEKEVLVRFLNGNQHPDLIAKLNREQILNKNENQKFITTESGFKDTSTEPINAEYNIEGSLSIDDKDVIRENNDNKSEYTVTPISPLETSTIPSQKLAKEIVSTTVDNSDTILRITTTTEVMAKSESIGTTKPEISTSVANSEMVSILKSELNSQDTSSSESDEDVYSRSRSTSIIKNKDSSKVYVNNELFKRTEVNNFLGQSSEIDNRNDSESDESNEEFTRKHNKKGAHQGRSLSVNSDSKDDKYNKQSLGNFNQIKDTSTKKNYLDHSILKRPEVKKSSKVNPKGKSLQIDYVENESIGTDVTETIMDATELATKSNRHILSTSEKIDTISPDTVSLENVSNLDENSFLTDNKNQLITEIPLSSVETSTVQSIIEPMDSNQQKNVELLTGTTSASRSIEESPDINLPTGNLALVLLVSIAGLAIIGTLLALSIIKYTKNELNEDILMDEQQQRQNETTVKIT